VSVAHSAPETGHGRRESRSIKIMAVADDLGGIAFPHAKLAIRIHRRRAETRKKESRMLRLLTTSARKFASVPSRPQRISD
jgi:hypothetical protein